MGSAGGRGGLVLALTVGLITCLAACGGTTQPSVSGSASANESPSPGSASPTPSPSASSDQSPSPSSSGGLAPSLALAESDLPTGGPSLSQISDGLLNNTANTDQRVFANSDNTFRLEDDILIDTSAAAATNDYSTFRDAAKGNVSAISSQSSPSGLGSQADEFIGTDSSGRSIIAISLQEGSVIVALLEVASSGTVDQSFAESVAQAQDQKIMAAGG
jgi:hypothetical protein